MYSFRFPVSSSQFPVHAFRVSGFRFLARSARLTSRAAKDMLPTSSFFNRGKLVPSYNRSRSWSGVNTTAHTSNPGAPKRVAFRH